MEDSMPAASINRTALSLGLIASALGLGLLATSPADARTKYLPQRTHGQQVPAFTQWSYGTPGGCRNTPPGNVACWTPRGHPGSSVMGSDTAPSIRQQRSADAL